MVDPADEYRHEPGPESNWQENYMFLGWDDSRGAGIYLHLAHVPATGTLDVKALVADENSVTTTDVEHQGEDCLATPGLDVDIRAPLEHWKLRFEGFGTIGVPGTWTSGTGPTPFGFDLDLRARIPAVDWSPVIDAVGIPERIATTHYEQGVRMTGRIWAGDKESTVDGLLIRDHSWGPRNFDFTVGYWTPAILDGGHYFVCGMGALMGSRWLGFLLHTDSSGTVRFTPDHFARVNGPLEPGKYTKATVLGVVENEPVDRFEFDGRLLIPIRYETLVHGGRIMTDLYSTVRYGAKSGFGTFQWA